MRREGLWVAFHKDLCGAVSDPSGVWTVCLGCVWSVPADTWGKNHDPLLEQQPKDNWRSSPLLGEVPH